MLTYKIYPRVDRVNKNGLCPIYVMAFNKGESQKFKLELSVDLKHFDLKKNRAKTSMNNYTHVNIILGTYEQKADDIIHKYLMSGKPLTYAIFKDNMLGEDTVEGSGDFFAFIKQRLLESNFGYDTQRGYMSLYNILSEFSPKLTFADLNYDFMIGFRNYLISKRGNVENTWTTKFNRLKALINEAINKGLMKENPVEKMTLRKINPYRLRLELHEVEALQTLYDNNTLFPHQQNVLQYFLFSCYTGLRFSDVEQFSTDMIINDKISIVSIKTKETLTIPLLPQAKAIFPVGDKKFRVISNPKTNLFLKDIVKVAGINKPVHFHSARHSFATICVTSGIRIEVISKILGHADLKTTSIYAKIMDDVKVEEMKLWGKKK